MNVEYRPSPLSDSNSNSIAVGFEKPLGGIWKRGLDIVVALSTLIFLSPLFLLVSLLVKLSDGGPVFYSHTRIGYKGNMFGCLKFRTMCIDADERLEGYLKDHPDAADEWEKSQKLKRDPRLTAIGSALRKTSLDELPQLINILRGDMSLVGPRPVILDEIERYGPYAAYYYRARPGLTGLWQVSGRNDTTYDERVEFDVSYCINWSIWKDLTIVFRTLPVLFSGHGSY
jgi:exopolysaccharide production protein ExoY